MSSTDFTEREQKMMAQAWQCFEADPKIDFKKLAELCGMSNPRSATNAWSVIKKKIAVKAAEAGVGPDGATVDGEKSPTKATAKTTPKATPKRKKNADGDDEESPTKKPKTPKGKGKGKKSEAKVEEDGEGGGSPIKKQDEEEDQFD